MPFLSQFLPIYPGLGQAANELARIPSGLVRKDNWTMKHLRSTVLFWNKWRKKTERNWLTHLYLENGCWNRNRYISMYRTYRLLCQQPTWPGAV